MRSRLVMLGSLLLIGAMIYTAWHWTGPPAAASGGGVWDHVAGCDRCQASPDGYLRCPEAQRIARQLLSPENRELARRHKGLRKTRPQGTASGVPAN